MAQNTHLVSLRCSARPGPVAYSVIRSLRDRPDHSPTLDSRGLVGLKQHRYQDAWNDYDAATRLGAGPSWVFGRGVAALRLGRTAEGQADIARAEAMNSGVRQFYADFGIRP